MDNIKYNETWGDEDIEKGSVHANFLNMLLSIESLFELSTQ